MQRYKKHFVIILKLILLILIIRYLVIVLFNQNSIHDFQKLLKIINQNGLDYRFALIIVLFGMNHFLEAIKWKYATRKIQKITWKNSFHAVFSGIAIGSITPNHIGDYGGKILKLEPNNRAKGVAVNFVISSAQLLTTLFFGSLALFFVIETYYPKLPNVTLFKYIFIPIFLLAAISLYFSIKHLSKIIHRIPVLKKISNYVDVLAYYKPSELLLIFLLSCTKYLAFTFQYILAVKYVKPELSSFEIGASSALIFLTQTIVPSFAFTELFVRGSIAAYFFSFISNDLLIIVLVTFSIWILNVIIPAIIGSVLILKSKF